MAWSLIQSLKNVKCECVYWVSPPPPPMSLWVSCILVFAFIYNVCRFIFVVLITSFCLLHFCLDHQFLPFFVVCPFNAFAISAQTNKQENTEWRSSLGSNKHSYSATCNVMMRRKGLKIDYSHYEFGKRKISKWRGEHSNIYTLLISLPSFPNVHILAQTWKLKRDLQFISHGTG